MNAAFDRFVLLNRRKKILKEELDVINKELDDMHEGLIDDMSELGVENFKTEDGETLYIHTRISAVPKVAREEAAGALQLEGHGDLVNLNFHAGSVSSLMRELEDRGEVTDRLKEAFHIHHIHTVRVRGLKTNL